MDNERSVGKNPKTMSPGTAPNSVLSGCFLKHAGNKNRAVNFSVDSLNVTTKHSMIFEVMLVVSGCFWSLRVTINF